jgi:hypothetical protein
MDHRLEGGTWPLFEGGSSLRQPNYRCLSSFSSSPLVSCTSRGRSWGQETMQRLIESTMTLVFSKLPSFNSCLPKCAIFRLALIRLVHC